MIAKLLGRKIFGAISGAVAVAMIFSLFGYSDDGATISNFVVEVALALASFVPAAFLMHHMIKRQNVFLEILGVTLIGSCFGFLLKLIILEGQNGIPAYFAAAARDHSWTPWANLIFDAVSFTIFETLVSLPFVALGFWVYREWGKLYSNDREVGASGNS